MARARRTRKAPLRLLCLGLLLAAGFFAGRPFLERALGRRIVEAAARRGLAIHVDRVRITAPWAVKLDGIRLAAPGSTLELSRVAFDVRPIPPLLRLAVGEGSARLPAGIAVALAPSTWSVLSWGDGRIELERTPRSGSLRLHRRHERDATIVRVEADRLEVGNLARVSRDGRLILTSETVTGSVRIEARPAGEVSGDVELFLQGARFGALSDPEDDEDTALGRPTDVQVSVVGSAHDGGSWIDLPCWRVASPAGAAEGSLRLLRGLDDAWVDLEARVPRLELGPAISESGLPIRFSTRDLGSFSADFRVTGRLRDPDSLEVSERLDFVPPREPLPALTFLRGPFVHRALRRGGGEVAVAVDPASPTFVRLDAIPPLFVRALTLSEDAGFWSHPGIDLKEIPVAFATNWVRGRTAFGASTITQQLAKNLFLSRDRRYGRKLQEAALALLLDSSLDKRRILEIYLNVIEWGPDLHGIGPACRTYFGKEPANLTPKEMAFLVALIPGPVKYQSSFASGSLSPGFASLVNGVLAKLRSVGALTEAEYEAARAEQLSFLFARHKAPAPEEPPEPLEGSTFPPPPPDPGPPGGGDSLVRPPLAAGTGLDILRAGSLRVAGS